jgi:hypothetical protein
MVSVQRRKAWLRLLDAIACMQVNQRRWLKELPCCSQKPVIIWPTVREQTTSNQKRYAVIQLNRNAHVHLHIFAMSRKI